VREDTGTGEGEEEHVAEQQENQSRRTPAPTRSELGEGRRESEQGAGRERGLDQGRERALRETGGTSGRSQIAGHWLIAPELAATAAERSPG